MASNRGSEPVRRALGDCLAVAHCTQEWRPPFEQQWGEGHGPVSVTVHEHKLVTVIPTHEWTQLVFALRDMFREEAESGL